MTLEELRVEVAELCPEIIRLDGKTWVYVKDRYAFRCINNDPLSDLNACAEILRVIYGEGWYIEIRSANPLHWVCCFWKKGTCMKGEAQELAEAICRAFVALHEGTK